MQSEWSQIAFGDQRCPAEIIDGDRGKNYPSQDEFLSDGHCVFLNAGNVRKSGFDFSDVSFISSEKDAALRKGKLQRNDVVLTTRGTVGNAAFFDSSIPFNNLRINSGMVIFRAMSAELLPRFLYFFLQSPLFIEQMRGLTTGSAQPQFPIRDINRVELPLAPMPEQHAIVKILGALDDKIELNRNMSATLEAIARALFRSWFVTFDPVHAKAEGHDPGLPREIAALFPDSFHVVAGSSMPSEWTVSTVGDVFVTTMGQSPPGHSYNQEQEGLPFYQGRADFDFRFPKRRVYCNAPTRYANPGDTLLSVRAPVGDINLAIERCSIGRGVAALRHNSDSSSYSYYAVWFMKNALAAYNGEGTVFGSISKVDLSKVPVLEPPKRVVLAFDSICGPIDTRIRICQQEIIILGAIRDALLLKLFSGELRVTDAMRVLATSA